MVREIDVELIWKLSCWLDFTVLENPKKATSGEVISGLTQTWTRHFTTQACQQGVSVGER